MDQGHRQFMTNLDKSYTNVTSPSSLLFHHSSLMSELRNMFTEQSAHVMHLTLYCRLPW